MIRLVLTAAMAAALMGARAQADDYYMESYAAHCPVGGGAEGIISVGAGKLLIFETSYDRVGERKTGAGGWQTALWRCDAEGEPCGDVELSLRITPATIAIKTPDGVIEGRRCPR